MLAIVPDVTDHTIGDLDLHASVPEIERERSRRTFWLLETPDLAKGNECPFLMVNTFRF